MQTNLTTIRPMEIIYHYCDASAFLSIITNKKLWVTNTRKMNDHSEGHLIEKAVAQAIRRDLDGKPGRENRMTESDLDKVAHALAMGRPELFACCFSREKDSTAQWLNYADRGRGFAIGFDRETLWRNKVYPWNHSVLDGEKYVVPPRFSRKPDERLTLTPVLYMDGQYAQQIVDEQIYHYVVDFLRDGTLQKEMVNNVAFFSSIAKDASFRHENELRLVYAPSIKIEVRPGSDARSEILGPIEPMKWRTSAYGVTPYFEFSFTPGAVREVWIGPANPEHKDHAARHLLYTLLTLNGFWDVQFIESKSPYR